MQIAEKQMTAAKTGTYEVTGTVTAHELKTHLRAGRTCEHLNIRVVEMYGELNFTNVKHTLQWLRIS